MPPTATCSGPRGFRPPEVCCWPGCQVKLTRSNQKVCPEHQRAYKAKLAWERRATSPEAIARREAKARREAEAQARAKAAAERREQFCRNGHPRAEFTILEHGQRRCLKCRQERDARRRASRSKAS